MKTLIKLTALTFMLTTLAACSSAPVYKEAHKNSSGYKETRLAEDRYSVAFTLRRRADHSADDYALLRAAELTLLDGYDWFIVEQRQTQVEQSQAGGGVAVSSSTRSHTRVQRSCGLIGCTTHVSQEPVTTFDSSVSTSTKAKQVATLHITLGKGVRPSSGEHYDARELRERLHTQLN